MTRYVSVFRVLCSVIVMALAAKLLHFGYTKLVVGSLNWFAVMVCCLIVFAVGIVEIFTTTTTHK